MVFRHPDEKTLYVAGDTIWFDGVAESLRRYRPDVVVVNACAAELLDEGRLIMDDADVAALHAARPEARIIVSHMDTVPHAALTRRTWTRPCAVAASGRPSSCPTTARAPIFNGRKTPYGPQTDGADA